jgi:serine/threonine protein kinase
MKKINSEYVVHCFEVIEKEDIICLVQDFCNGGDLQNLLNMLPRHRVTREILTKRISI